MQKVIPGSSRAALAFMLLHWKVLAMLSIAPAVIMLGLNYLEQEYTLLNLVEMSRIKSGTVPPMLSGIGTLIFLTALNVIPTTWLFVRITQYFARQQFAIGLSTPREIPNTLITMGYGFLISLICMMSYFLISVVMLIVMGVDENTKPGDFSISTPSFVVLAATVSSLVLWLFYRFAIALPGVALDERPSLFQDVWPLAKGESFAVPARIALSLIAITALFWFYGSFTTAPVIDELMERFRSQPVLTVTPEVLSEWNRRVLPFSLLGALISLPFIWFISLLLAEAYTRFRRRGPFTI